MGCYYFGPFELDPAARVLRREGHPVAITAKIFELLIVLVENPGRVMTKDELFSSVWSDATVEEANLAQSISVLRKTLEDNPKEHRYIVTIPGRGYEFVATVTEKPAADKLLAQLDRATTSASPRLRLYHVSLAVVVVLLVGITGYVAVQKPSPALLYSSTPLTSYRGSQICPSFAPDGDRVAFAWDSEGQGNFNIYVKQVGVAPPLRLTSGPEPDISPAWSPDGRSLALASVSRSAEESEDAAEHICVQPTPEPTQTPSTPG